MFGGIELIEHGIHLDNESIDQIIAELKEMNAEYEGAYEVVESTALELELEEAYMAIWENKEYYDMVDSIDTLFNSEEVEILGNDLD